MSAKKQNKKAVVKKIAEKETTKRPAKIALKKETTKKAVETNMATRKQKSVLESNFASFTSLPATPGLSGKLTKLLSQIPPEARDKIVAVILTQGPKAARAALDFMILNTKGSLRIVFVALRAIIA